MYTATRAALWAGGSIGPLSEVGGGTPHDVHFSRGLTRTFSGSRIRTRKTPVTKASSFVRCALN